MADEAIQGVVRNHKALKADFRPGFVHGEMEHDDSNFVANFFNGLAITGGKLYLNYEGRNCVLEIGSEDSGLAWSFQVRKLTDTTISVRAGYNRLGNGDPTLVAATSFTVSDDGSVYQTLNLDTGVFSAVAFGAPPTSSPSLIVRVFADVSFSGGIIQSIVARQIGDFVEERV